MNIKTPLVSILVPVYNVEEYLETCLNSLINQTLKNIEIICVNDGATDRSGEILNKYAEIDSRIKIINKPNGGLPSARNAGLDAATGQYVGFVDADDYVAKNMFERMYKTAKKKNAEVVVCGAHIVPDGGKTQQWLKDVLSPNDGAFGKNSVDVLIKQKGARPFLWRNLISKKLIDKYNFRLEESIVVGEDQAFQFKVFPKANRIAFISDKLYYYRTGRSGSIMSDVQHKDNKKKMQKHIALVEHIARSWAEYEIMPSNEDKFFNWAIEFIYWDMLSISACDRAGLCEDFCNVLIKHGYFKFLSKISGKNKARFEYMYKHVGKSFNKPIVSVVIPIEHCCDYLTQCLNSVINQSCEDIEILLYNNKADEETDKIANEFMHKDLRISMRTGEWKPIADLYNDAIKTARGEYILFLKPYDYYYNPSAIKLLADTLNDNEVDLAGVIEGAPNGLNEINACECADFYSFAYRVSKLREISIYFEDCSMLTGSVFFTKYCLSSTNVYNVGEKFIFRNMPFKRSVIYVEEAKIVLKAMITLLRLAKEHNLIKLQERISDMLDSENFERLITDSTFGFVLNKSAIKNPKEKDFRAEVFDLLVQANGLLASEKQTYAANRTLIKFIQKRHEFLENV